MRIAFSLRWLFALVASAGIACLALRNASYASNGYLLLGVFVMLAVTLVGALVRTGAGRACWTGAAVCGWLAFLINGGPAQSLTSNVQLPTDRAIDALYTKVARSLTPEEAVRLGVLPAHVLGAPMAAPPFVRVPNGEYFRDAAHHLLTLGALAMGGALGGWFHRRNAVAAETPRGRC